MVPSKEAGAGLALQEVAAYLFFKSALRDILPTCAARDISSAVSETNRLNVLRLRYKLAFDACKAIAVRNAKKGSAISDQERAEEIRAAEELQRACDELMASTARLGN